MVERKKKGTREGNFGIVYYILNNVDRVVGLVDSGVGSGSSKMDWAWWCCINFGPGFIVLDLDKLCSVYKFQGPKVYKLNFQGPILPTP